jgi:prepilin-type N-terminal cleavage/methylation domain-containing protein/prepilin-type processing-associated H-X9-DG protein
MNDQRKIPVGASTAHRVGNCSRAFTLIEILIVIVIIGIMIAISLPAVQAAREASRRNGCLNNVKNIGIALHSFHDAKRTFPMGSDMVTQTEHAWSTHILPYLEEQALYRRFDFKKRWNDAASNKAAGETDLSIYRCPSATLFHPGKQDYGGIVGTNLTGLPFGHGPKEAFGCGTIIICTKEQKRPVAERHIIDGLSKTICVAESIDRTSEADGGLWACGRNCIGQIDEEVSTVIGSGAYTIHTVGVNALFADGHTTLLTDQLDFEILGAYCTRNGGEPIP